MEPAQESKLVLDDDSYANVVTLLAIGKSGTGKTTLINAFVNHFYDTKYEDKRLILIPQKEGEECSFPEHRHKVDPNEIVVEGNTGESKTQKTESYYIKNGEKSMLIIDTPGIGDSRGLKQDQANIQDIIEGIRKHSLAQAILLVVDSTHVRDDFTLKYYVGEIRNLLTKSCCEQIIVVCTRNNGNIEEELVDIISKNLGFRPSDDRWFCMDNKITSKAKWMKARSVFNQVYTMASGLPKILTKEVEELYNKRKDIERKILVLIVSIEVHKAICEDKMKEFENRETAIDEYEQYYQQGVTKKHSKPTTFTNYNCHECHATCVQDTSRGFFRWFAEQGDCQHCKHPKNKHVYENNFIFTGLSEAEHNALETKMENILISYTVDSIQEAFADLFNHIIEETIDKIAQLTLEVEKVGAASVNYDSFLYYVESQIELINNNLGMDPEKKKRELDMFKEEKELYLALKKRHFQAMRGKSSFNDELMQKYNS